MENILKAVDKIGKIITLNFGIDKCKILKITRRKFDSSNSICLDDNQKMKAINDIDPFKHIEIAQTNRI